jgi:hypothetical protein
MDSITLGILLGESCYNCIHMLADYSIWLKDHQQPLFDPMERHVPWLSLTLER